MSIGDSLQSVIDDCLSAREDRNAWHQQIKEDNRITISEIRSDTHNLLERIRQENKELVDECQSEDKERRTEVKEMLVDFHQETNELRKEMADELREAHEVWNRRRPGYAIPAEKVIPKPEEAAPKKAEAVRPGVETVLEVISKHPDGIRLIDIGNEVGVDWRTLIAPAKSLVDEGRVEKIENMYYPNKE